MSNELRERSKPIRVGPDAWESATIRAGFTQSLSNHVAARRTRLEELRRPA